MEIKKIFYYALFLSIMMIVHTACKKDGGDDSIAERPIVEAYLINGKAVSIRIYQQKGLLDTSSYGIPISGLSVSFNNGDQTVNLKETARGEYTSSEINLIIPGKTCSFNFNYNGINISGATVVPGVPINFTASSSEQVISNPDSAATQTNFNGVTFNWNMAEGGNYLIVFKNRESTPNRIGSGFGRRDSYSDIEQYLGNVSTFEIQRMTFSFAGYYDTYLYHINAEYNAIVNSSSTTSLNLTNPPSNIKNGLGIFTAMSCDSLLIHVYEK